MPADVSEPGVRARRAAEAREKMVAAATELIAEGGSAGMTLARVGTAAGYSRGLADYHFGSKSALIQEVVRTIGASVTRDVLVPGARAGGRGLGAVLGMLESYLSGVQRSPARFLALYVLIGESFATVPEIQSIIAAQNARMRAAIEDLLNSGLRHGSIRHDIDVPAAAGFVLAVIRGATLQYLADPDQVDLDAIGRQAREILQGYLAAPVADGA